VPELFDDVPERALAVYAHPDDPDVSCGGTLARWAAAGSDVHVLICTNGDKGSADPDADPDVLAEQRAVEAGEAAKLLGVAGQHFLGYPDGELVDDTEFRASLVRWVRTLRPHVVLGPDPTAVFFGEDYFNHRDHRTTGFALLDALSPAAALPHYFPEAGAAYQVQTALLSGTLEPSVWVDVTTTIEDKVAAVSCHRSQFGDGGEWARQAVRERAREDGRQAGVGYAEGFRRLRLGG
jgi:LmbE family N-acetylglucosaminyl deacetylase